MEAAAYLEGERDLTEIKQNTAQLFGSPCWSVKTNYLAPANLLAVAKSVALLLGIHLRSIFSFFNRLFSLVVCYASSLLVKNALEGAGSRRGKFSTLVVWFVCKDG